MIRNANKAAPRLLSLRNSKIQHIGGLNHSLHGEQHLYDNSAPRTSYSCHRCKTTKSHSNESTPSTQNKPHRRKSSILPTLDASPLLDPTLYIKKSAIPGGTTSISGGDAAKRLRKGQDLIRHWISQRDDDDDDVDENEKNTSSGKNRLGGGRGRSFALVGHGVPMQLLQSCVDSAWDILNEVGDRRNEEAAVDVEECFIKSDAGLREAGSGTDHYYNGLDFDGMRIRTKEGKHVSIPWPMVSNSPNNDDEYDKAQDLEHSLQLYLTVMSRIASTFATTLISSKTPPNSSNRTSSPQSLPIISQPLKLTKPTMWKAEILKGFVYPPSATIFSTAFWNDGEDCSSGQRIGDLTSPPIVELEYTSRGILRGDDDEENDNSTRSDSHNGNRAVVWITLQGIPSSLNEENTNEDNGVVGGRGLVPVSLVFEAAYDVEDK